jgi:hypothetical protein
MSLYDVLDQIIELLRQRKRLTYRLLKREFALDDETLEDLKDELIYAQKLAVEEDERVLVWIGDTEGTHEVPSPRNPDATTIGYRATQPLHAPPPEPHSQKPNAANHRDVLRCGGLYQTIQPTRPQRLPGRGPAYQTACTEVIRHIRASPNSLGMVSSCILAIPRHMKTMRSVRFVPGWRCLLPWRPESECRKQRHQLAIRIGVHTGWSSLGKWASRTSGTARAK